jgi:hypothetical protein
MVQPATISWPLFAVGSLKNATGAVAAPVENYRRLEHDPEKWKPVFAKDHAQNEKARL